MVDLQHFFYLLGLMCFSCFANGQTIVNGSFEITTAPSGCNYNLANAVFNGYMTDVVAYGGGEETDIIMDGCYVSDLPDGERSISIAHVPEDEISMLIDVPLIMGETYTLSFWALSETTFSGPGDVVIGASTSSIDFGTLIQTVTPTIMSWGNHTFTFVAPNNATHITVRNAFGGAFWNHLDHFEFILPVDAYDTEVMDVTCFGACDGSAEVVEGVLPPYTYLWDDDAGAVTTAEATGLCAGTYSVEVTNGADELDVIDVTVGEPDELVGSITSQTNISCFGLEDGAVEVEAVGGTGDLTYDIGDGPVATGDFMDLAAGLHTVTITDENDCSTEVVVDIIESTALILTEVSSTDLLCNGDNNGEIEVIGSGGSGIYTYAIDDGLFGIESTFTDLTAGDYLITVQDANGCEMSIILTINEPDALIIDELVTDEICMGDCMGAISLMASGGIAPYTFSIDDCATTDVFGEFSDLCVGAYDICIEDANGCQYTNVLNVDPGIPPVDATIVPFGPLCIDADIVVLDAMNIGIFTGSGVLDGMFDPSVAGAGIHTITNIVTVGCGGLATYDVVVNSLPLVTFSPDENDGCPPIEVLFTNTGDAGVNCEWNFGDGETSMSCGPINHIYSNAGTYDVTLSIIDANGCSNSTTYSEFIEVHDLPNANFIFEPINTTTLDTEVDFTDYSTNASAWLWTFDSYGNSTDQHPSFGFPEQAGAYYVTLVAISDNGCLDTITKLVKVDEEQLIFAPNAITPDGDAYNEVFKPYLRGIDIYDYHLTVYNRWGETMFESYNLATGWNGSYGGEIVPDGVYIWRITAAEVSTDRKLEFQGHLSVLK